MTRYRGPESNEVSGRRTQLASCDCGHGREIVTLSLGSLGHDGVTVANRRCDILQDMFTTRREY